MADKKHCGKAQNHSTQIPQPASSEMTRIYMEMRTSLMRFAYRYFKTPQEIEDVVQEAFVKVIEANSARRRRNRPEPLMMRLCR